MFLRSTLAIGCFFSSAFAGIGPQALYNLLNGQTFNPPGYTIVMYQSCMQNQNAGNPCGSFSTFETSNGVYTRQLYGPAAAVSTTCSRTFYLTLACGATMSMSGVNENPTCVYSATLTLPQACGIDMTVGNEAASVSGTAVPATPSITRSSAVTPSQTFTGTETISPTQSQTATASFTYTGSGTQSQTATASFTYTGSGTASIAVTPTKIYDITLIPSQTVTPSVAATTTPLFMITAWPTPSPVNVSATSSPRFMMTAYPTNSSGAAGGGPSLLENLGVAPGSSTATILGGVAVGAIALAGVAYAVYYFRNGGTVGGLVDKIKENKDKITSAIETVVPMTEEQKAKLHAAVNDPTSLMPTSVQRVVQNASQYKEQVIASLPISEEQKAQLTTAIDSVQQKVVTRVMQSPVVENTPIQIELTDLDTAQPHVDVVHTPVVTTEVPTQDSQQQRSPVLLPRKSAPLNPVPTLPVSSDDHSVV